MSKVTTLSEQVKKFISEHPDSESAPLFKEVLRALNKGDAGSAIREAANRGDGGAFLNTVMVALSETHLCASCQGRINATIAEAVDGTDYYE